MTAFGGSFDESRLLALVDLDITNPPGIPWSLGEISALAIDELLAEMVNAKHGLMLQRSRKRSSNPASHPMRLDVDDACVI